MLQAISANPRVKGMVFVILSAVLFGVTPVFTSKAYLLGSNPVTQSFFRGLFAVPVLFLVLRLRRTSLRVSRQELFWMALMGVVGQGATSLLLCTAYVYVGVGTATTLHFMYPVCVALICRIFFRERLGRSKTAALAAASFGVVLFLEGGGGANAALGAGLAVASSVTYAAYMVVVDKTCLRYTDPFLSAFYMGVSMTLALLAVGVPTGQFLFPLPLMTYVYAFLVGLGASFFAVVLLQVGVRYLSATTAAVFSLFEPVTSSLSGALFLGEGFTLRKLLGSVVILGAAGIVAAAKPSVSPDSEGALDLLMSAEGFPHPPEGDGPGEGHHI